MAVPPESIEVGRCYLTRDGRLRRVTGFRENGEVGYKYRTFPANPKKTWRSGALRPDIFAATVEREVPCDWTPDGGEAMTVPEESIQVGKCYLGDNGKVWRVVRIWPDGRVQFEFRSRTQKDAKLWKPGMLEGTAFAASAQREVPCDWTPETDGQPETGAE